MHAYVERRVLASIAVPALTVALALAQVVAPQRGAIAPRPLVSSVAPAATSGMLVRPIRVISGDETIVLDEQALAPIARLEPGAFDTLLASIAARFDRQARDAELRAAAAGFAVVPASEGLLVDRADLAKQLVAALYSGGARSVVRPRVAAAPATLSTERLAATALVSEFTTYFPRDAARATNIKLAASRFDGQVVKPGQSFSFWDRLGDVSYEAGFVDAGAIIDRRSDKALAGGICQVSTTLFNAVARAGYQIDERHAHSYYIERYPIGLDAAVLFPAEDFRWTNDTADPVLIRTSADDTSVAFRLYSLPSGRVVSFGTPVQRNLVLPATDQPADPAHAAGYVVRGRDVVVTWTVSEDDVVLHGDSWTSHYSPVWGGPAPALTVR